MKTHSFEIDIATTYGITEAILIFNLQFWISKNKANKRNFHDGRYWTSNSAKAFSELFPYLSESQIRNALQHLIDDGVLISGNYNKIKFDRTKWYAFVDESFWMKDKIHLSKSGNANEENEEPIPDINTDKNHQIKNQLFLAEKKKAFEKTCFPYVSVYGPKFLRDFCEYWCEPENKKNPKKLRFELEQTWDIAQRLATWYRKSGSNYEITNLGILEGKFIRRE